MSDKGLEQWVREGYMEKKRFHMTVIVGPYSVAVKIREVTSN